VVGRGEKREVGRTSWPRGPCPSLNRLDQRPRARRQSYKPLCLLLLPLPCTTGGSCLVCCLLPPLRTRTLLRFAASPSRISCLLRRWALHILYQSGLHPQLRVRAAKIIHQQRKNPFCLSRSCERRTVRPAHGACNRHTTERTELLNLLLHPTPRDRHLFVLASSVTFCCSSCSPRVLI